MTIYQYAAFAKADWPTPLPIGAKPTTDNARKILRAATVLSNMRWSASIGLPGGVNFSNSEISFFCPMGSTGRFAFQLILQSPNSVSATNARIQSMAASTDYLITSGTDTTITNPTDLRGATGTWRMTARMANNEAQFATMSSGCPRVNIRGITGSGPATLTIIGYPYWGSTSANGGLRGWHFDGTYTPGLNDSVLDPLTAGFARAIEGMLDAAEAMPVIFGILPRFYNFSGITLPWAEIDARRALSKQIPLSRSRRISKSVYIALNTYADGTPTVAVQIGGQVITSWVTAYHSGRYWVLKAEIESIGYESVGDVDGVPIVQVQLLSFPQTFYFLTGWVGES